jgi:hypothetical protein
VYACDRRSRNALASRGPRAAAASHADPAEVRRAAPTLSLDYITWCTTLGGVEAGRLDLRPRDPDTGECQPEPRTNCPQNVLEPILLRSASLRLEARVVLGAECTEVKQTNDVVTAHIRRDDGTEHEVEAAWAIAADGAGSPTRRALGIPMQGPGPLARFAMIRFEADLRPWIEQRSGPLFFIQNPESPGCLIVHDPARSHVFMTARRGSEGEDEEFPARLATALGVSVTPKILSIGAWSPSPAARDTPECVTLRVVRRSRADHGSHLLRFQSVRKSRLRSDLLAKLGEMPPYLAEKFAGLTSEAATRRSPNDGFSPVEQCWHLVDLEREGFALRMRRLRSEERPLLPDFDGTAVARERNYRAKSLVDGLDAFSQARAENLALIASIANDEWRRDGVQEGVGNVALCDVPVMMSEHDAAHRAEIEAWFRDT